MQSHVRLQYLDDPTCAFLQSQTFEHDIVGGRLLDIDKGVLSIVGFEDVWVDLVTDFASKGPPIDGLARMCPILALLRLQPVLEADVVDVADTSTALANGEERVLNDVVAVPAESAEGFFIFFDCCSWRVRPLVIVFRPICLALFVFF